MINLVIDKFDLIIIGLSLMIDFGNEIFWIYFSCVVMDVMFRVGDVVFGMNDLWKVVVVVDLMGIIW